MRNLLTAILGGIAVGLAAMAARQWRRRRGLARAAFGMGLQYSLDDPFDLVRRYAGSFMVQAGHGASADNVVHGHVGSRPLRAFDFRFEAGHGPRRVTRRMHVVSADAPPGLPDFRLWLGAWNLSPPRPAARVSPDGWEVEGDAQAADRVARLWRRDDESEALIEAVGGQLLFVASGRLSAGALAGHLRAVADCLAALGGQPGVSRVGTENPRKG